VTRELFLRHCFGEKHAASGGELGELRMRELVEATNLDEVIQVRKDGTRPEAWRYPFGAFPLSFFNPASKGLMGSFSTSVRMAVQSVSRL
jgi:hypothetical protein